MDPELRALMAMALVMLLGAVLVGYVAALIVRWLV